mgnify:CR=1 FL=1|tara:strand:- start:156148 stop:156984 length:837 start_codon:yes stop_codon:yes gene_type:complete
MIQSAQGEVFQLETSRHKLHAAKYIAANAKAVVCIIHGFGEHFDRFSYVADRFLENNISCYGIDLPGHGKSEGKRGNLRSLNDYLLAVDIIYGFAIEENAQLPVFLYGHSMGGAIVARYLLVTKVAPKAAIITSPWLELVHNPGALQVILGRMSLVIGYNGTQKSKLNPEDLSRDLSVGKAYLADPFVQDSITPRTFFALQDNANFLLNTEYSFPCPILLAHGTADNITKVTASQKLAKQHPANITLKIWQDLRHETHNEINKNEVTQFYINWILENS